MTWPTSEDYVQALQSPRDNLARSALKNVQLRLDDEQQPYIRTGRSASVFKVSDPDGTPWALRCFVRASRDSGRRYRILREVLGRSGLPYFVEFDHYDECIQVAGKSYPLIQMEWVGGEPLAAYVERHAADSSRLMRLARQLHTLVQDLEAQGLAHGDLSGDNVHVVDGQLRLVDYDSLYSPRLRELGPFEDAGSEHFRHPRRPAHLHFGPDMDRFPALVCITSLHAIAVSPSLWKRFGGPDRLLFQESDFKSPDTSPVFQALLSHPDGELRRLSRLLADWCAREPSDIPELPRSSAGRFWNITEVRGWSAVGGIVGLGLAVGMVAMVQPVSHGVEPGPDAGTPQPPLEPVDAGAGPTLSELREEQRLAVEQALDQAVAALARGDFPEVRAARLRVQFAVIRYQHAGGSPDMFLRRLAELDQRRRRARLDLVRQQTQAALAESKKAERKGDYSMAFEHLSAHSDVLQPDDELTAHELQPFRWQVDSEIRRLKRACRAEAELDPTERMAATCPE